jgi:hypothetical protein
MRGKKRDKQRFSKYLQAISAVISPLGGGGVAARSCEFELRAAALGGRLSGP